MKSFRQEITEQIERIPKGRIFTAKDLTFDVSKTANVNVLLAELVKKGRIKRIEKGAYYRFGMMKYGLGPKPIYQEEKIRYILSKTGGYLSGYYAYNLMGLTEQVPTVITIATPNPVRAFRFVNLRFNCIKACKGNFKPDEVEYLRVLDVVNHIKHVPGRTGDDVYRELKELYFSHYTDKEIDRIAKLSEYYPPVTKTILSLLLDETGHKKISDNIKRTINPITFNKYLMIYNYGTT